MKSLNDILWNKVGEVEEEEKNNEYESIGQVQPPMLTDNCTCQYHVIVGPGFYGFQKMCN